ncbi:hypothetical protein BDZ97DRAFT_1667388 [Flammula alnicola]|nr:hypothetical protein BDZ97DRAFT_1667388 [Flammula alnicola]
MSARPPYNGPHRKLVLAFDVGTTFSGISYVILDPGAVPEIRGVTRFPAQEDVGGDSKIPTIVYYDKQGQFQAAGAEALDPRFEDDETGGWTKAEWRVTSLVFKLHMRPKTKSAAHVTDDIPPLPQGKTAIDVFADFLRYLYECAQMYIEQTHANGVELWRSLQARTEFVLTHPNGWEGAQQSMMRKAAVTAGLIPDTENGRSRLSFVTEGEASLHFCIQSGSTSEAIKARNLAFLLSMHVLMTAFIVVQNGKGIIIVDAGGGTIDISTYKQTSRNSQSYEEIAPPECHFKGSIFVTNNARRFLENSLKTSRFFGDVPHITNCFDKTTKLRFRNAEENQYIKFGTLRDKDPALNIRSGQLKLLGSDVASFFEPSVQCIVKSIEDQIEASQTEISSVFLVGGFAASEWLFTQLKNTFSHRGLDISRPDSHVNKAVADGAISFHIDHFVSARVSKLAYGTRAMVSYDPTNLEHVARSGMSFRDLSGDLMIGGVFNVILPKDTKVTETQEFREAYYRIASDPSYLELVTSTIICYRGKTDMTKFSAQYFVDKDPNMYSTLCEVKADLSRIPKLPKISNYSRSKYYTVDYDIVLSLGLTEMKAHICWKENVSPFLPILVTTLTNLPRF